MLSLQLYKMLTQKSELNCKLCFLFVTIYLLFLSKRLLSYLIFGAYLILSLDPSLHIAMKSHSPDVYFILGYRVFDLFIF